MIRVTGFIHHDSAVAADVLTAVREVGAEHAAPTEAAAHRAGQTMALSVFDHVETARSFAGALQLSVSSLASHVEVVRYAQGPVRVQEPDVTGIQRTLLLHVLDSAGTRSRWRRSSVSLSTWGVTSLRSATRR